MFFLVATLRQLSWLRLSSPSITSIWCFPAMSRNDTQEHLPLHNQPKYEHVSQGDYAHPQYGTPNARNVKQYETKSRKKLWIVLGIILALCVIAGAVVGGVVGSRDARNSSNNAASNGGSGSGSGSGNNGNNGASVNTQKNQANYGLLIPTTTDALGNPIYPTATGSGVISMPTLLSDSKVGCQADPYNFPNSSSLAVRDEHPLLIAPAYRWDCVRAAIPNDYYLNFWNDTIFGNASRYYAMSPTNYTIDGGLTGSGVLDVAREVQLRIKHWAYAYRMTNDTKWVDRVWLEVQTAAGNSTTGQYFGITGDNWNSAHFLDLAEFTAAFAIAYDWLYDAWTPTQRSAIMWSILNLGLSYGLNVYEDPHGKAENYSWWQDQPGNWDCVCTNGLIMGSLAIANEDPTGMAAKLLPYAVTNNAAVCAMAVQPDGTWTETPNYWYFGAYAHSEAASSLLSATGSTQNLLTSNPAQNLSSLYHMYVTGQQGKFDYGDTGPRKFGSTANGLLFYGDQFDIPMYSLYQRDRGDVTEPFSMFWYNPESSGSWWDNLPLDHHFANTKDDWGSMRSTWTDNNGTFVGMKAGNLTGHQTHGDLDGGDFVLDALGQRWAGENGNGQYLANGYFTSEDQDAMRWTYYQKGSQGQNTILINEGNQNVLAAPPMSFETTGEAQTSLDYDVPENSTALMIVDMTTLYNYTSSAKRAIRFINRRQQVLIRDEVTSTGDLLWRMQSNATITFDSTNTTATLTLGGQSLVATLRQPSTQSLVFTTVPAVRLSGEEAPVLAAGNVDTPDPGVTVLTVAAPAGTTVIEVLFNPQYPTMSASDYADPPQIAIDDWSLTSHN